MVTVYTPTMIISTDGSITYIHGLFHCHSHRTAISICAKDCKFSMCRSCIQFVVDFRVSHTGRHQCKAMRALCQIFFHASFPLEPTHLKMGCPLRGEDVTCHHLSLAAIIGNANPALSFWHPASLLAQRTSGFIMMWAQYLSIPPFQTLPMKITTAGTQRTNRHVDEPYHGRTTRCR